MMLSMPLQTPAWPCPTVVVSQCLGFAACRWNGLSLPHAFVERLKPWVEFRPVCAEVEIGLGVPRQPVRVVRAPEGPRLMQPATGNDYTAPMNAFSAAFLDGLEEVGGFILKGQSPSCGWRDCKLYASIQKGAAIGRTDGLFAAAVAARFPALPVETETRLDNPVIREHFLTKLFTLARFGQVRQRGTQDALVRFQTEHKLLLMAYHQSEQKVLGRIVANQARLPLAEVIAQYEQHLALALARAPRAGSHINVQMHALGYFSPALSSEEKAFFLDALEKYRQGTLPLSVPTHLLKGWLVRFGQDYLSTQSYFQPYPQELADLEALTLGSTPGRERDYWKENPPAATQKESS